MRGHDADRRSRRIQRHLQRRRRRDTAEGDPEAIGRISAHIEEHLGPVESVFHELVSDVVHVDVHLVAPRPERDFWTLVTTGMSDRPMTVPEGAEDYRHGELVLCLPPGWPLAQHALKDERNYWPVRWLKILARLPHEHATWLGWGHTVPNHDPPQPVADGVGFCCMLVENPVLCPEGFHQLEVREDKRIRFYSVVPIYREEMELKLEQGTEALERLFDAEGVTELVDVKRRNVCAQPRLRSV